MATAETSSAGMCSTVAEQFGVGFALGTYSGRAALLTILRALHRLRPQRNVIAVPGYVCFSVPAAVARAGLRVLPVEMDPHQLDYDFEALAALRPERLLAVLSPSLFGLVNDLKRIEAIARSKGAFVIDDAAQAFGASREGRLAGTAGDVGFFSFGRGKVLGSLAGGMILTRSSEIARAITTETLRLPPPAWGGDLWLLARMVGYAMLLNPHLYWLPNSLPLLGLGTTEFDPDFKATKPSRLTMAMVQQLLPEVKNLQTLRRRNACSIACKLQGLGSFSIPQPAPECEPSYIRLPVIARDEKTRDQAVAALLSRGIGASLMYPTAVCDIPGIGCCTAAENVHCPRAESLARSLFTLPTSPYLTERDLEEIARVLRSI